MPVAILILLLLLYAVECLFRLFAHSHAVVVEHVLRQIAYHYALGHRQTSGCGLLQSGEYLEHGALACSVLAHQGYFVFWIYLK